MQSKYVPVLVVTGHLFGKAVGVAADVRAFAINGIQHAVQPVVGELVAAGGCLAARLPGRAADVAVVAGRSVPGVVIQVLRELAATDGCESAAELANKKSNP